MLSEAGRLGSVLNKKKKIHVLSKDLLNDDFVPGIGLRAAHTEVNKSLTSQAYILVREGM